jgi:hypothetical protein
MELTTIDTNNYKAMAKAMGIAHEGGTKRKKAALLHDFALIIHL